jgi:hypothetical protein
MKDIEHLATDITDNLSLELDGRVFNKKED